MMDDREYLRNQIYSSLDLRETEDLIEIWQQHDTTGWTELAFDVLKEILQKRIGTLPPQDESGEEDEDEFMDPDTMVQGGDGITQIANPPTCPNCLSSNVFRGEIVLLGSDSKLALKSMPIRDREVDEMTVEYSEVVGLGCNDCGHVFLMLKEHG